MGRLMDRTPEWDEGYAVGQRDGESDNASDWDAALDGVMDDPTPTKVRARLDALEDQLAEALRQRDEAKDEAANAEGRVNRQWRAFADYKARELAYLYDRLAELDPGYAATAAIDHSKFIADLKLRGRSGGG